MEFTADPAAMRQASAVLRLRADQVGMVAAGVRRQVDGMVFAGPAADRLRAATRDRCARTSSVVARLHGLANTLARSAARVEAARFVAGPGGAAGDGS